MASKVNTKFVVILSLTMFAGVAAVGGTLYWVKKNDATRLIRKADEAEKAGDLKTAERALAKAVNKRQTDGALLKRWVDVLQQITPETQTEYTERYREYVNGLRSYATLQQTDVAAHKAYLDVVFKETIFSPYDRRGHDYLIDLVDRALGFFEKSGTPVTTSPDTLRRYRGISRSTIIAQVPDQLEAKDADAAIADLTAAIKADNTDEQSLTAMVVVYSAKAVTARRRSVDLEATAALEAAHVAIDSFLKDRPDSPAVKLSKLELDMDEGIRAAMLGKVGPAVLAAAKEKRATYLPELDPIAESLKKVGPSKVEPNTLARFMVAESIIDPAAKRSRTESVLREFVTRQPDNFFALQLLADMLAERGETDESIQTLQKIIDLPRRKLGVEGVILQQVQPALVGKQARFAMIGWERARTNEKTRNDPAIAAAALTKAKDFAAKFRTVAGETPLATLLDAQIAFAENDLAGAQKLLQSYNAATRDADPDGLWLQAQVMLRNNSRGATEQLIEKVIKLQPSNISAYLTLIELKSGLQKFDDALSLMDRVDEMDPGNQTVARMRDAIDAALGKGTVATKDPVLKAVAEANKLVMTEKNSEAIEVLRKAVVANKYDVRLTLFLTQQLIFIGDKPGALATVEDAFKNNPDAQNSSQLKNIEIALKTTDPMEAELQVINSMNLKPFDLHIYRATVFRKYNKLDDAGNEIKEALKINPDDVKVIELAFLQALETKNFPECLKYVEIAEKRDLDRTGGRTFRARYLFGQGQTTEAISLMEIAAKEFALTADTWRVLGRMQSQIGRGADAIVSYEKALDLRPDDVSLICEHIISLSNVGRNEDALAAARAGYRYGQSDRRFTQIYLDLEGEFGDKTKALETRKKILTRNPKDRENRMAICWLLMDLKQFDEARTRVDELRKEEPEALDVLVLDARFSADRGDFSTARNLFAHHINAIPREKLTSDPYMAFARMMFQYDQADIALNALDQGRRFQSAKNMEADRMISDQATRLRRAAVAEGALRRIIAAKADTPEQIYTRRLIENLNSQRNYADAQTLLTTLTAPIEKDVVMLLLAAETAHGLKDDKKAQDLLDRAKTTFPTDARVWIKSAQFNMARPELASDAEADLNRAVQLDPRNSQIFEIRGGFLIQHEKIAEGITDLQKAVSLNPGLANLRLTLIRELVRRDRGAEALSLAEEAVKSRGNDVQLALDLADVFADSHQLAYAARFFKRAWELNKTPLLTQKLLDCLLNAEPPILTDAENVIKDRSADIEKYPELRIQRAKLHWRRGRMDEARRDMRGALDLIAPDQANSMMLWYTDLARMYPKSDDRTKQLDQFEKETTVATMKDWLALMRAMTLVNDPLRRANGIRALNDVIGRAKSDIILLTAYQQTAIAYYLNDQIDESVDALQRGIAKYPDDWELNNNAAFTLATSAKRAKDALPYALKAIAIRPDNVDSLDTLGTVYLNMGDLNNAEESLRKAIALPGRVTGQTSALMHLCKTLLAKKNFVEAQKIIADLDSVAKNLANGFPEEQKKEFEALKAEAASASPQNR